MPFGVVNRRSASAFGRDGSVWIHWPIHGRRWRERPRRAGARRFADECDEVSDGIFAEQSLDPTKQRHSFDMRRRWFASIAVVPTREAVSSLTRRDVCRRGALPLLAGCLCSTSHAGLRVATV